MLLDINLFYIIQSGKKPLTSWQWLTGVKDWHSINYLANR